VAGKEVLFGTKIERRESEFAAGSGAADDSPRSAQMAVEAGARLSHIAFGNFAPMTVLETTSP